MPLSANNAHVNVFPREESEQRRRGLIRRLSGVEEFLMECAAERRQKRSSDSGSAG